MCDSEVTGTDSALSRVTESGTSMASAFSTNGDMCGAGGHGDSGSGGRGGGDGVDGGDGACCSPACDSNSGGAGDASPCSTASDTGDRSILSTGGGRYGEPWLPDGYHNTMSFFPCGDRPSACVDTGRCQSSDGFHCLLSCGGEGACSAPVLVSGV